MGVLAQRFVDIRTKAQRDKQQKLILAKAKPLKEAFVRLCSDSGDEARIFQENLQGKRATTTKARHCPERAKKGINETCLLAG